MKRYTKLLKSLFVYTFVFLFISIGFFQIPSVLKPASAVNFDVNVEFDWDDYFQVTAGNMDADGPTVADIQYNLNGGSWISIAPFDGSYNTDFEVARVYYADLPPGGYYEIDVRAIDSNTTIWPSNMGPYLTPLPSGVTNPFLVSTEGGIYNTNYNGNPTYFYADITVPGDYTFETYDVGGFTSNVVEYYGTDSTYTTVLDSNSSGYSSYTFTAGVGQYYLTVMDIGGGGDFGARLTSASAGADVTIPITSSGVGRVLLAHVAYRSNIETVSDVTFDGQIFSSTCVARSNEYTSEIWYLNNPNLTTADIEINFTGVVEDVVAKGLLKNGIDNAHPFAASSCNQGNDTAPTATINSPSQNNYVYAGMETYSAGTTITAGTGMTEITNEASGNSIAATGYLESNYPTTNATWSLNSSWPWAVSTIALNSNIVKVPVTSSGDNRMLLLHAAYRSETVSISSVTFNGVSFSSTCQSRNAEYTNEIWYLNNPAIASGNVEVIFSGGMEDVVLDVVLRNDINNADPVGAFACNQGNSTDPTVSVSTPTSNQILFGGMITFTGGGNSVSAGIGMTELWNRMATNTWATADYVTVTTPTTTATWDTTVAYPWSSSVLVLNREINNPPEISFSQVQTSPSGYKIEFAGTATDVESTIADITVDYAQDKQVGDIIVTPTDGIFDGASEGFTITIYARYNETYDIDITVTDATALSQTYNYLIAANVTVPTFVLENLGADPIDDNTLTYTEGVATAQSAGATVANVEYNVYSTETVIDWTAATPSDGIYDGVEEDFEFTTTALPEGVNNIRIRVTDSYGNVTSGDQINYPGVGYVADRVIVDHYDETAPIVQVQDIIPDPTTDATPPLQGKVKDNTDDKTSNIAAIYYRVDAGDWIALDAYDGAYDSIEEQFSVELEGLSLGDHDIDVRAVDAEGNDTNIEGTNDTISFTIIAQPDYDSVNLTKTEDFSTHDDQDFIGTVDTIWGNGRLRLAEEFNPVRTLITGTNLVNKYIDSNASMDVYPSQTGGIWFTKDGDKFTYVSAGGTEYEFDLTDYGYSNNPAYAIKEIYWGGDYYVWLACFNGLIGINFGSSIIDTPVGESSVFYVSPDTGTRLFEFDTRDTGGDYGIYFNYQHGIGYYVPGEITDPGDDQFVTFTGADGYTLDGITALYFDQSANQLWVGDYTNGTYKIDDNGTPTNKADDSSAHYAALVTVFDIGIDKNDKIFLGGDNGLQMILDDNGTEFIPGDDTIQTLATTGDLGIEVISDVEYLPGDGVIGGQFFMGTRAGYIVYLSVNDTYTDVLDDQIITIPVSQDDYPADINNFYMEDDDTMVVGIVTLGGFRVALNRGFVATGIAMTEIDAQIEGRLDVDFITLNSVDFIIQAGGTTYEVSNDGGLTWYPITIGQTINFPEKDYRIKFRLISTEGSTPVIDGFNLSYSAYMDYEGRDLNLEIDEEPAEVYTGDPFSFLIKALDELQNPYEEETIVNIQLRNAYTNEIVSNFNISNAVIEDGQTEIDDARANVVGLHYITASTDGKSATSELINFIDRSTPINPNVQIPALTFVADRYTIQSGETITLSWNSSLMNLVSLSSEDVNYGYVATAGTKDVTLYEDTLFTLTGTGDYGTLTRTVLINVQEDEDVSGGLPPVIERFILEKTPEGDRAKVKISWKVLYVDTVDITHVGKGLPAEGTAEVYIDRDTEFTISARNDYGDASETKVIEYTPEEVKNRNVIIALIATVIGAILVGIGAALLNLTAISTLSSFLASLRSMIGFLLGIVIPRKRKYWGIVFDIKKSKPLPFAVIHLYRAGVLVDNTVTDIDGRYGFLLEQTGKYKMVVAANGFKKYEEFVHAQMIGNRVEIVEDVPLERTDAKVNPLKKSWLYSRKEVFVGLKAILLILMVAGFAYTIYATIHSPIWINFVFIAAYAVLFALNLYSFLKLSNRFVGRVIDIDTKKGVAGASVRIYRDAEQIGVYLTNTLGELKLSVKPGEYWIIAHCEGYVPVTSNLAKIGSKDSSIEFDKIIIDEAGYLVNDILLKKVSKSKDKVTLSDTKELLQLNNPFN